MVKKIKYNEISEVCGAVGCSCYCAPSIAQYANRIYMGHMPKWAGSGGHYACNQLCLSRGMVHVDCVDDK